MIYLYKKLTPLYTKKDKRTYKMEHYALTGYPLGHSVSPAIHERLFALSKRPDCSYRLLSIPPEEFPSRLDQLKQLDGFNITIPHKQTVIPFLDELASSAARYRAVNVVQNRNGQLTGHNTDVTGFLKSVEQLGIPFTGGRVLVLGYGGAGRMMASESAFQGAREVLIACRKKSLENALRLADELQKDSPACRISACPLEEVGGGYDLIINSTPSGMYPHKNESPLKKEQLKSSQALFDAIYNPGETRLMAEAKECGLSVAGGMTMLVWQAAAAHEIWYGAHFRDEDILRLISEMEEYIIRHFQD